MFEVIVYRIPGFMFRTKDKKDQRFKATEKLIETKDLNPMLGLNIDPSYPVVFTKGASSGALRVRCGMRNDFLELPRVSQPPTR